MSLPLLLQRWWAADGDDTLHGRGEGRRRDTKAAHDIEPDVASESPDISIVAAIRASDHAVFERLVLQYGPELVRLAYAIVGHRSDAEDAAQDVFLWLWAHRTTWTPRAGVRAYLLRAAANRARDLRRTAERRQRFAQTHLLHQPLSERDVGNEVPDAALWTAIQTLPDRWREGIMLRYVEGMAFAEVGAVLGVSEDAAKKVVRRALVALRAAMTSPPRPS